MSIYIYLINILYYFIVVLISDQTKLIDLEEMAKTVAKGKWAADTSDVSILPFFSIKCGGADPHNLLTSASSVSSELFSV